MFFVQIARLTVRVLNIFRRGLLLAAVLLAVACLAWLKHSTAVIRNQVQTPAVVVSAASNETDALAPDSLATAYGARLAVQSDIAATPQTELAGTTVTVAGLAARLLFASPGQINFLIPAGTPTGSATVRVRAADGTISEGTTIINTVAPALFATGGVASGFALRVKADGAQSYEAIAEFDAASGQLNSKAIDLNSAAGDQVFLVFFLSGLRNADPAQVRVILGGDEFTPVFAGAVPGAPGLDQINLLLSRELAGKGVLDLAVKAPNARPSNTAKIQIGGGASTLTVSKLSKQTVVAGETLEIEGANLPTSNVEVLFEPNVGVAPETITPTKMTLRVPYGVATGAVKISVNKQIAYVSPQPMNVITSVSGFIEEFKDGKRVAVVGLPVVLTEPGGRSLEAVTNSAGAFLIRDAAVVTRSTVQIKGLAANGLNYEASPFGIRVFGNRDNQASQEDTTPRVVELKPNGSVTTGFVATDTPLNESLSVAAPNETAGVITSGQVTFDTGNSTINCPGGASGCQLALNVFDPGRTPTNLPAGVFSSTIAQITPFGATLTPGGKLTFPNSDATPAGTALRVYRYDQTPTSATFGQFVDIGPGIISSDGQRLETEANAVTQASYYLISRQWRLMATIIGHVVEADGVRPVRRAVVSARGQSTFTDGNGGFVLRNLPVIKANDTVTLEVSFHRADGTVTRTERAGIAISENAQVQLATDIPLPARSATSGPTILAPDTLSITEGETRDFNFLVTDLPTGVAPALVSPPSFATLRSLGADAFALRLTPPTGSAGNYQITIGAGNARQTLTVVVIAANSSAPIARSQAVTTNEDTPVQITLSGTNAGSTPTYAIAAQPLHGSLSGTPPNLTYTPAANYNGTDGFSFRVNGSNDPRSTAVVSIAVRPVNDPPIITVPGPQTISAGQTLKLTITATDPDGDALILTVPNAPPGATQSLPQTSPTTWQFSWTPTFAQAGTFAMNIRATDAAAFPLSDLKTIPITVESKWARTSGPAGGDVVSLAASGSKVFAGTYGGGLFFSNNEGRDWVSARKGIPDEGLVVYSLAFSGQYVFAATQTAGIYRSADDGRNWEAVNNGITFDDGGIPYLSVIFAKDSILFAGGLNGIYRSFNAGNNWTLTTNGLFTACGLAATGTFAAKGNAVFAGTGRGVFRSDDNGTSWRPVNNGLPPYPDNCGLAYVNGLYVKGTQLFSANDGGLYVSTNDGQSWQRASEDLPEESFNSLVTSGPLLFVAGLAGLFVSGNDGRNWRRTERGLPKFYGDRTVPVGSLTLSGNSLLISAAGVYRSINQGEDWSEVNTGLNAKTVTELITHNNFLFAGTIDSGVFRSDNGGKTWLNTNNGFINFSIFSFVSSETHLFAGTEFAGVYRSADNGANWTQVSEGLPIFKRVESLAVAGTSLFAGLAGGGIFDVQKELFGGGVHRSTNNGTQWLSSNGNLPRNNNGAFPSVNAVVWHEGAVWIGTQGHGIFRSTNNGVTWSAMNIGLPTIGFGLYPSVNSLLSVGTTLLAGTAEGVFRLTADRNTWLRVLDQPNINALTKSDSVLFAGAGVVFSNPRLNIGGVFMSLDNGLSWTPVSSALTNRIVSSLSVQAGSLFAGTAGSGVSVLTNNVQTWTTPGQLPNGFINALSTNGADVFAGTLGGGVFRLTGQSTNWTAANNGLPQSANVQTMAANGAQLFAGLFEQGVYRSSGSGSTWTAINIGLSAQNGKPMTVHALKLNKATLLAGTEAGVYRLENAATNNTWTATTGLLRDVRSLLVNKTTIYAGTFDDGIYLSVNDGQTWQAAGKQGLSDLTILALGVSANGASIFAGTNAGIYRSDNGGQSWRAVNGDLPVNLVVTSFLTSGARLYAASIYGMFLSEDNGENWKQINAGLLDIYTTSLALDGDRLIAGTKVGGVFISQIPNQAACIGIALQPAGKTISSGQSATLTVTPSGDQPFQFQWYQGASGDFSRPIAGATGSAYTTPQLTATTNYWVLVTNGCGSVNSETASVIVNAVPQTDLAITQTISPAQPKPGDTLTFTFTLTNRGGEKALAVNVTNPLPVEVDFVSCTATGGGVCGGAGNNRTVFFSEMAGNASATVTLTAKVKADAGGKTLRNNAGVSAATNDANLGNNSDPKSVTVQQTVPVISGLNPAMAIVGGAGFTLVVNGSNFVSGAKVRWNGTERVTAFISGTQLTAQIPNTDLAAVGTASVTVANPDGQTSNSVAFAITAPQRQNSVLRVVASTGGVGSTVAVPIELVAQGDENALGFSLTFDPTILSNPQVALGNGASGAALNPNLSQAAAGRLGLALAMPSGQRFAAGVRQIAVITFAIAANTGAATANLEFGSQPIAREVSDVNANELGATYMGGAVTITRGFEADVAPRPNGNGALSVTDWVLVGRFASGDLAVEPGSEFQRADCAPRSTFGNGAMSVTDWVQAGRYAAGLDPQVPAAGPTAPGAAAAELAAFLKSSGWPRLLRVGSPVFGAGQTSAVTVELLAQGEENAVSFSLQFDARQWRFVSATPGEDARQAALSVNTKFAADGQIGFALALPPGRQFDAGMRSLLTVTLVAAEGGGTFAPEFAFSDWPAVRELASLTADALAADWLPAAPSLSTVPSAKSLAAGVVIRVGADGAQRFEPLAVFDPAQNTFVAAPIEVGEGDEQVFLALFGTGWRSGAALDAVRVTVGDLPVEVLYAGEQAAGLAQLNLRLPSALRGRGELTITLTVDGKTANPVTVVVK